MVVDARFEGPPGCANGGYVAGLLGGTGPAQVTLRRPVPTGVRLSMEGAALHGPDGELLAEAAPAALDAGDPPIVAPVQARAAAAASPLAERHPFPGCFACGPDHPSGLHNLAGPVAGRDGVWAVDWTPDEVSVPIVWAALDCPSSAPVVSPAGDPPYVLGRIAARIDALPQAGRDHVLVAWALGGEGRRREAASALLDGDGAVLARARATWVALRGAPSG